MLDLSRLLTCTGELAILTREGTITWEGNDMIGFRCAYKGCKITVWWWQDSPTGMSVDDASIEGYGYGIEDVIRAIREQEKKKKESPELLQQYEKEAKAKANAVAENIESINGAVRKFLHARWS